MGCCGDSVKVSEAGVGQIWPTPAAATPHAINDHTDVDTSTVPPGPPAGAGNSGSQQGDVLTFDGSNWTPQEYSYRHVQGSAALVWTVNHNLGRRAAGVYVANSFGEECVADITQVSDNQLTITFSAAESGKAYII